MKAWLMSICAVVLLTVLLELLIGEGKIKKYVRGVVRLALIATIFLPVLKFVKSDINFDLGNEIGYEQSAQNLDNNFINSITELRYKNLEKDLEKDFTELGINGAVVNISIYYGASNTAEIDFVTVDLTQAVISDDEGNILLTDRIKETVTSRLSVSKEKIIIYGI